MSYTLDELLDTTGVSDLSGRSLTKKAGATDGFNLSKLAERCRRAVDATPQEHATANQRELVEKTAAVAIISRTLSEIREIEESSPGATKTAAQSSGPDQAEFVKAALEAGHQPQEIAEFLEKSAGQLTGRVGRWLSARKASKGYEAGQKAAKGVEAAGAKNIAHWQHLVRQSKDLPAGQRAKLLARMQRTMGPERTSKVLGSMGNHSFKDLEQFKDMKKNLPKIISEGGGKGGKQYAASMNIGGSQVGITAAQADKAKKPLMYAGAGMLAHKALSKPKEKRRGGGRGPVIITG